MCYKDFTIEVKDGDMERLEKEYVQDVLHYLTDDERELIISGICGDCFNDCFSDLLEGECE
jgi:hypothetical protein